jgi:antitoxin component YwqK of YwqJK toxin-antitoxin module
MSKKTLLPRLSRTDFYRLREDEFMAALAGAIAAYADEHPSKKLTANQEAAFAWSRMSFDIPNGGFTQFFYNHRGDSGVAHLADLFDSLGLPKAGALLRDTAAVYRKHRKAFAVDNPWEGLFGSIHEFDKLDRAFGNMVLRCNRALEQWVRCHIAELANDEAGRPIDPEFTGSVEIMQPNGLVGQYLEVKKGKPNGAYRQFFDDGTVRKVIFYKSGKVSGDFWPNGQLKQKESKRGSHIVTEWFYPSGKLQKRHVRNKDGYAVEPVRLFHENGQLAEEITSVRDRKRGPWLKFFDDGSPKLRAEYARGEKLIVHDAWNDDRTQTVKDGAGTFHGDGRDIDAWWTLFSGIRGSNWRDDTELKDGIPHGKTTTYHNGVLWRIRHFVDGVQEGDETVYWENGRVRSITKYVGGKAGKPEEFPKYDRPVPAVVLSIEADDDLCEAWEEMKLDEYPRVLNLDEVQTRLQVPDFLREVYERNLSKTIRDDYEDWNTFKDGIGYRLTVNEAGEVASVEATGASPYSGGDFDTYPPFLQKLRFTPGRVRGRAVSCRVLASVDHTFVEG